METVSLDNELGGNLNKVLSIVIYGVHEALGLKTVTKVLRIIDRTGLTNRIDAHRLITENYFDTIQTHVEYEED